MSPEDIKFISNGLFQDYFQGLENYKYRVSLINYLKTITDNVYSVASAVDILLYLLRQLACTSVENLEKLKGWIIRPYEQIEIFTGCPSLREHPDIIRLLIKSGLVNKERGPQNKSKFKIDLERLDKVITGEVKNLEEASNNYFNKVEEQRQKRTSRRDLNSLDWEGVSYIASMNHKVNEDPSSYTEEDIENIKNTEAFEEVKNKGFTRGELEMIYEISSLYKEVFNEDYPWTSGDFNTYRKFFEGGLSSRDLQKLEEAMGYVKEGRTDNLKGLYLAKRVLMAYQGYLDFNNKREN